MSKIIQLHPDYRADDEALSEVISQVLAEVASSVGPQGVADFFAGYKDMRECLELAA